MKTPSHFIVLLLVALLPASCGRQEEVVHTESPVATETAVSPQPTATIQPTPTLTLVDEGSVVETAVPTSTPTAPVPTETPIQRTPLPTRPAAVPDIPFEPEMAYEFVAPSSESLMDVLRRLGEFEDIHIQDHQNRFNYRNVHNLLFLDVENYFPKSFPNASELLNDIFLTSYYGAWSPSQTHYRLIEDGIVQYLNHNKVELTHDEEFETDAFILHPYSVTLDEDTLLEWVIQVESKVFHATKFLLLEESSPANYSLLSTELPGFGGVYHHNGLIKVYINHDLTGDSKNEIIVHSDTYLGGNSNDVYLEVYSWSENNLQGFPRIDLGYYSLAENKPTFEIRDFNDDGVEDIQVVRSWDGNFECDLEFSTLHTWQDTTFEEQELSITNTPACQLWRSTFSNREIDEEIELLENALAQWESMPFPPADLIALTRLHLALAQYAKGNHAQAQSTLDKISNLHESSRFGQLVLDAYDAAEKDPIQTCRNMLDKADQTLDTDIGLFLTNYKAINGWVDIGGELPNLPTICDIQGTAINILETATLPINQTPPDLLADLGIRFDFATAVNLDNDPELEWLGILEPQIGKRVTFDAENENWTFKTGNYWSPVENFEAAEVDVTGDGKIDLVSLTTEKALCYETMAEGIRQSIDLLYTEDESARFYAETLPCNPDELRTIERISIDDFSASTGVEWRTLANYPATTLYLYEYVPELQTAVLTQSDSAIPEKISELLTYLPADDPEAQPTIEHLTYLLGYHYELNGDAETAVSTYLTLIRQAPNSPWSWLAWARLAPVES